MADLVRHELGVHLRMPHAAHVADIGLGGGAAHAIARNPIEWWYGSQHNLLRPPEAETAGQRRGSALHTAFLDGLRVYKRVYGFWPTRELYPDHIETIPELLAACRERNLSTAFTLRADLVDRLLKWRPRPGAELRRPRVIDSEIRKFQRAGKTMIAPVDDAMIRMLHRMAMREREELQLDGGERLVLADAFRDALTEISIFWVDANGIRWRARFDILRPNFTGDLKAITEWRAGDFKQSLLREAVLRGYVVQWALYDEARRQLRIAVDEGRVFGGTKTARRRLARIADADAWSWIWVFCKMDGAPQVRAIRPSREANQYKKGVETLARAIDYYVYYEQLFGLESMWLDLDVVWEPEETDWPQWSVLPENL